MDHVKHIAVLILLVILTACSGGGGGVNSSAVTTVSGVATKGIFKQGGTVTVYPVTAAGAKGSVPLAVGKILDANGSYSVNLGSYSGPIVVEAYGDYDDEATGTTKSVPVSAPLRAALDYVTTGKSFKMPVTPLTDLAYRQAGLLTPATISAANDQISYLMRIDIVNTIPVAATSSAFAVASQSQKDYSLILAAVSQIMANAPQGTTLEQTLADMNSGLATTATATALNDALAAFVNPRNTNNKTGLTSVPPTVQNLGTTVSSKKLTLQLSGDAAAIGAVQAFSVTLSLPAGLMLRTDEFDVPLTTLYTLSGSAAVAKDVQYTAHYAAAHGTTPATLVLAVLAPHSGLTAGDVISITCDIAGSTTPAVDAHYLTDTNFRDGSGSVISGPVFGLSLN